MTPPPKRGSSPTRTTSILHKPLLAHHIKNKYAPNEPTSDIAWPITYRAQLNFKGHTQNPIAIQHDETKLTTLQTDFQQANNAIETYGKSLTTSGVEIKQLLMSLNASLTQNQTDAHRDLGPMKSTPNQQARSVETDPMPNCSKRFLQSNSDGNDSRVCAAMTCSHVTKRLSDKTPRVQEDLTNTVLSS
mmetsp:Transcript_59943/g.71361  ORF Transcript_59943/g.71361 Transcript_59943/m.71361 type:complete len:189 (+) Transcript_59943:81-647(+)